MKVNIKELGVAMDIKRRGMMLDVYQPDGKKHLGDLQITSSGLIWCNGRARNGTKVSWKEFIDWMNS